MKRMVWRPNNSASKTFPGNNQATGKCETENPDAKASRGTCPKKLALVHKIVQRRAHLSAEGAETEVLTGGRNTINKYRPIILVEVNINEISSMPGHYSVFQAPGSPNQICLPNESPKIGLPQKLGWNRVG